MKTTPRQVEIARELANGLSSKEIASKCGITVRTVESHRRQMLTRYKCRNTAHLVSAMTREGII